MIMDRLIRCFPKEERPSAIDILTARGDQRKPVDKTISKSDLEIKVASISCEYLEELYLEETLSNCNNQNVQEVVRQFDSRANEAIDKYLDSDKTHSDKIREFLLVNDN